MQINKFLILLCATFLCHNSLVQSAKILALFPFPGPSQYICVQAYLKALAARGHQVTVISSFPQQQPVPNFRDIPLVNAFADYDDFVTDAMQELSKWQELNYLSGFFNTVTINAFENKEVQELINSNARFDLIIVEVLQQEALYALAHHFKAHLIGVSTFGTDPHIDELVGNVSPVAYTPLVTSSYSDHMDFWQRLDNLYLHTLEHIFYHYVFMPKAQALYEKFVPNATLDLYDYRKNFALILLNQHFSMSFPRPYVPNAIEVGGMHIQHVHNKLPQDMEAFINDSVQGAIYFSLGSNIKSNSLPLETRKILMKTFASLPVNVLWKFEDTELPGKPDNVFINKWFPQPDVLAHPKVHLFVTHGGLLSTMEAIYHAKPIVGLPIFYDQHLNVKRARMAGFGLSVNFRNFTEAELRNAIMEVLQNSSYAEKAKLISRRYHDQPIKPLDKAIYWTEYLLRHDGAPHMRVAGQELNFIQVHSLDTIAVLFGGIVAAMVLAIWLVVRVLCLIFGGNRNEKKAKQKQQ